MSESMSQFNPQPSQTPSCFQSGQGLSPQAELTSSSALSSEDAPQLPVSRGPQSTLGKSPLTGPALEAQYCELFSGLCDAPTHASPQTEKENPAPECGEQNQESPESLCTEQGESALPTMKEQTEPTLAHNWDSTPLSQTALRANKFLSDGFRLPGALKAAGQQGGGKLSAFSGAWSKMERAGLAGESFLARHLPKNAGRWIENTKTALGYATLDPKTILKHLGGKAQSLISNATKPGAGLWAGELGATRAAAQAVERTAVKESTAIGGRLAGKGLGKLVPGINVGVALGPAGLDLREMAHNVKKKNYVGAAIDGLHAATDAAGAFPGVGTVASLLGDGLSIGAHWLTGR